jgi:MFS family permease
LFGYDQGVVSGVITMESFGAAFPRVYADDSYKGWFVSTLLLTAWFGSLVNGPVADRLGRKLSMIVAVIIFLVGSSLQAAASTDAVLFAGRAVAGFAVGMLTMVVPMYMSEISLPEIRGTLVVTQQLSITLGILVSYWLEYGTHFIGGVRCSPETPYTGGISSSPAFDPYNDVPAGGCTGQSDASWRIPLALQNAPALLLGVGMLFFPETPRWLLMAVQDERALKSLSRLRSLPADHPAIREELLAYKADVLFEQSYAEKMYPGKSGVVLAASQYYTLFSSWSNFKRLAIGCCIMSFQQFMVGAGPV